MQWYARISKLSTDHTAMQNFSVCNVASTGMGKPPPKTCVELQEVSTLHAGLLLLHLACDVAAPTVDGRRPRGRAAAEPSCAA